MRLKGIFKVKKSKQAKLNFSANNDKELVFPRIADRVRVTVNSRYKVGVVTNVGRSFFSFRDINQQMWVMSGNWDWTLLERPLDGGDVCLEPLNAKDVDSERGNGDSRPQTQGHDSQAEKRYPQAEPIGRYLHDSPKSLTSFALETFLAFGELKDIEAYTHGKNSLV